MTKNQEREEREEYWRRQQQNREPQERWSRGGREEEYDWHTHGQEGRDWRGNEDYERHRWQEMRGRERFGGQGMGYRGEGERGAWEGTGGQRWGNEDYDFGRERNLGMQGSRRWQGGRNEGIRGWEGGHPGWETGRRGWEGGEMQGRNWEGEYGNQQLYGPNDWRERFVGTSREGFAERGGMTGERGGMNGMWGREGQWGGGWNQGRDRGSEGRFSGRGPRSYKRSDDRIEEDVNQRLTEHPMIDATDIEVHVQNGEVTLRGHVDHREAKRIAEDITESVFGIKELTNQIKVRQRGEGEDRHETETSGKRERKVS